MQPAHVSLWLRSDKVPKGQHREQAGYLLDDAEEKEMAIFRVS